MKKLGSTRSASPTGRGTPIARRRLRRRLSGGLLLLIALTLSGGLAAVLTPSPQVAVADENNSAILRTGKQLFDTSCVSCHGANLQGVADHGPSLIGVGDAAVYFQVSTGRMPAMRGEAQAVRKDPIFDESQIDAIGAFVQANGGGPTVLRNPDGSLAMKSLRGDDLGRGGDLFRLNCASCHNFTGKGGALSSGKFAPDLGAGQRAADPHRDADRPAEHAEVLRPPAVARREEGHHRLRQDGRRRARARRLRPRWIRTRPRRHGHVDHRDGRRDRAGTVDWGAIMSDTDKDGTAGEPDEAALATMSNKELLDLGGKLDGVQIAYKEPRWPIEGTKAEKRAERGVALWLLLGGAFGLALLLVFLFWPWEYKPQEADGSLLYVLATPLYGLTFGMSVLSIAIGAVLYQKRFIPEEISIQDRHDGASREIDRKTVVANLTDALETSTIKRRKLVGASLGLGLGAFGLSTLVAFAGGLIKNPWKPVVPTAEGKKAVLWTSGWTPRYHGETIYLARATGASEGAPFVKLRPEDMDAGGMETVFPWRESDGDGTTVESHEKLSAIKMGIRNPVMLIRIKSSDMGRVVKRQNQESFNWGEFFAFTKVCSHLGCPSSLYEQQSYRILCPCHQSQFDALHFARPIFGPAARALAQLPITIDSNGYLVANGDFIEPVGPAFWERTTT